MIDRRGFLRGLVLSVTASGLILPSAAEALVLGDRYKRLVTAIRDVIDSNAIYHGSFDTTPIAEGQTLVAWKKQSRAEEADKHAAWRAHEPVYRNQLAELFRVLVEDFGDMTAMKVDPEETRRRVGQMIYDPAKHFDILDENELRRHEDILVSIAVVRILLIKYRMRTQGIAQTAHWPIYIDRYKDLVLNASYDHRYGVAA